MGIPKEEKRTEELFEMITIQNFPELMSDAKPQIQQVQTTPSRINVKNNKSLQKTYIVIEISKLQKIKYECL